MALGAVRSVNKTMQIINLNNNTRSLTAAKTRRSAWLARLGETPVDVRQTVLRFAYYPSAASSKPACLGNSTTRAHAAMTKRQAVWQ